MVHRIRWAMTEGQGTPLSGTIEADETYVGGKQRGHIEKRRATMSQAERVKAGMDKKTPVFGMIERGGRVRATAVPRLTKARLQERLNSGIDADSSRLMTDESALYGGMEAHIPHNVIRHKSEYVRGEVHTNSIEGFWSHLSRGLVGTSTWTRAT